jgi:hypothetical protein
MKGQRTGKDFSKYVLKVTKNKHVTIHELTEPPYSKQGRICFINVDENLIVTGDYSNWIFDRDFTPNASEEAQISNDYWCEKVQLSSTQKPYEYDSERTIKEIQERIDELKKEDDDYGKEEHREEIECLEECIPHADDSSDMRYLCFAHDNKPSHLDHESVIYCKKVHPQLLVVFDAFEIVCKMLADKNFTEND